MASLNQSSPVRLGVRSDGMLAQKVAVVFLVSFLLIFPKGGVKVAGVPITWGYLALAAVMLPFLLDLLAGRGGALTRIRLVPIALLVPFQAVVVLGLILNGSASLGYTISLLVTFFFLPIAFLLVLGSYLDRTDLAFVLGWIRFGVLAVAVYGVFLFFFKLQTGRFIEIPYLTVNAGDLGGLEDKYIDRGGIFKLISTYNNGNIYGVSLLILLPLYVWLEGSVVKKGLVKLSLLLTLSRTVWIGMLLFEVLQRVYIRRISVRTTAVLLLSLSVFGAGLWYVLDFMGRGGAFLLDRSLGGRVAQLTAGHNLTALPAVEFAGIAEIVYLSVLHNFGLVGLFSFLIGVACPVALHFIRAAPYAGTEYKKSLVTGLIIYLIVAMSDGALLYIPVMAIYWFAVSLLLSSNVPAARGTGQPVNGSTAASALRVSSATPA